jgi:dienelactone hydrolase
VDGNMLGAYGGWAAERLGEKPGPMSFRNPSWSGLEEWKKAARGALEALLHGPQEVRPADVQVHRAVTHDGLDIEELSWQLPYGPRTRACLLKPHGARGKLPGILAFHDHGGNKHFGRRKIVRTDVPLHPSIRAHQEEYYGGVGWANEIARRGFAVLVHDVFPFESRKILASDLPGFVVGRLMSPPDNVRELTPEDLASNAPDTSVDVPSEEPQDRISRYNAFAAQHESVVAKSLFSAGLTWPGVMVAEDRAALDYLASRPDVDPKRLGCGGLSGGGMRTAFLAGLDDRIRCAVCAGFMTTWRDFLLHTSYTHTWMVYVPGLPGLLDFPEVLGLRAPLPTLVLATTRDPLYTLSETQRAGRILEEVFQKAGAPERFRISLYPGPHKFDLPMQAEAFQWMEKWL